MKCLTKIQQFCQQFVFEDVVCFFILFSHAHVGQLENSRMHNK